MTFDEIITGLSAEERVSDIHVVSLSDIDLDGSSAPTLESRKGSRNSPCWTAARRRRPTRS